MTDSLPDGATFVRLHLDPAEGECIAFPGEAGCRSAWITNPRVVVDDERQPSGVDFGDRMRLVSAPIVSVATGQIDLSLYWEALGAARDDYTLFAHLIDADGVAVAQADVPLGSASTPTSRWPQGGFRWADDHDRVRHRKACRPAPTGCTWGCIPIRTSRACRSTLIGPALRTACCTCRTSPSRPLRANDARLEFDYGADIDARHRQNPGRLPDPEPGHAAWLAARLPGQRGHQPEAAPGHRRDGRLLPHHQCQRPPRDLPPQRGRHRGLRRRAQEGADLHQRRLMARDRVHAQHHGEHQPRGPDVGTGQSRPGGRGADQRDGAPLQHRVVAAIGGADRRADRGGPGHGRGLAGPGGLRPPAAR